jgi:hypothetical protein
MMRSISAYAIGPACVLLLAAGCGHSHRTSATQVVPSVIGLSINRAFQSILNSGLCVGRVTVTLRGYGSRPSDHVTHESPRPGSRLSPGALVSLTDSVRRFRLSKGQSITAYGASSSHYCPMPKVSFAK